MQSHIGKSAFFFGLRTLLAIVVKKPLPFLSILVVFRQFLFTLCFASFVYISQDYSYHCFSFPFLSRLLLPFSSQRYQGVVRYFSKISLPEKFKQVVCIVLSPC